LPSIEDNYSIDNLAHRAFAASICAYQSHDFPGMDIQVAIRKCYDTAVAFDDIAGGKRLRHDVLREEILLNLVVAHDVIQQVSIWPTFTHGQTFVQVVGGDNRRQGQDKG
jgi:hypothetical protein